MMTCGMCLQELLRRVSTWLRRDGKLFVHIFCHKRFAYHFTVSYFASRLAAAPACVAHRDWGFSKAASMLQGICLTPATAAALVPLCPGGSLRFA